jgi:hypothetical protein
VRFFISSTICGLEAFRHEVKEAIGAFTSDHNLDSAVVLSEEQAPVASSPVDYCREQVRQSTALIGIYGSRYGYVDTGTGKSATHLEMDWALATYDRPLLAFVVGDQFEPEQRALISRLQDFRMGVFLTKVDTPEQLRYTLYRALGAYLPRITFESSLLALRRRIEEKDLYHPLLRLRSARTSESSQFSATTDPFLDHSVREELSSGKNVVFVLGEVGAGKTWFLKKLFTELTEEYLQHRSDAMAIYIDLGSSLLPHDTPGWPWAWNDLIGPEVSASGRILLLDGYDEAVAKSPPGSRLKLLESVLSVATADIQVVITSRSHLFETRERLTRLIKTVQYSRPGSPKQRTFSHGILFVEPLSDDDVRRFLQMQFGDEQGVLWQRMTAVIDLRDLAKRPVLLPMVCESLQELQQIPKVEPVTAGHLYRIYTEGWLSRESWRLGFSEEAARRFFEDLALYFHNTATDSILSDEFSTKFPRFFPAEVLSLERERILDALRSATFLSNDEAGRYRFLHRSFLEYFLAERLIYAIAHREANLNLVRFPSKVTDAFVVDLLRRESGWEQPLLDLLSEAVVPIFRYLVAYLANRLGTKENPVLDSSAVADTLQARLHIETSPVVTREILVTLVELGFHADDEVMWSHLRNPIPLRTIQDELKDYYGSLEEARHYLRQRLSPPSAERLRLFYLISLASVAVDVDRPLLEHYAASANPYEARVAHDALKVLDSGDRDAE